ncbi:MAG: hypothetical protein M1818_008448 [Claussenomyces sp. TS43310]|nr:MAG: hypothetical protein M1818_008448 [Claussenomyces sp. TS43310]
MDGSTPGSSSMQASGQRPDLSAAERFEDEKRRIIDSCFNKKDTDGTLLESYITHIRIVEDAAYPSSPPPPDSNPDAKKPRLIIVAVRKSGRVRMHKARENINGTFSIGKTWPLDDLTGVESFSGAVPRSVEEEQRKQWAGAVGFVVSIGKPYYWQANTQKEKQFFIASLVKIYTKYTGGKSPELTGFDEREKRPLLGMPPPQARTTVKSDHSQAHLQAPALPSVSQATGLGRGRGQRRSPSREPAFRQPLGQDALAQQQSSTPNDIPGDARHRPQTPKSQTGFRRTGSPSGSLDSNTAPSLLSQTSLGRIAVGNPSQESFVVRDETLRPSSKGGLNGVPHPPSRLHDRDATPPSQRMKVPEYNTSGGRDNTDSSVSPAPSPLALPSDRRRTPAHASSTLTHSYGAEADETLIPAPLASPSMRRDDIKVPARSSERPQSPNTESLNLRDTDPSHGARTATSFGKILSPQQTPEPLKIPTNNSNVRASDDVQTVPVKVSGNSPTTTAISPEQSVEPLADHRPGLGPMIKKKSRADIANTFRKAASAANAFTPRAGGAAARLREQQEKVLDGPDGIRDVVPAPSLVRGLSNDDSKLVPVPNPTQVLPDESSGAVSDTNPEIEHATPSSQKADAQIPEVKVTLPPPNISEKAEASGEVSQGAIIPEKTKVREIRRQRPTSERTQKELASLGLDPSVLDGKGMDFSLLLDEFGWVDEGVHTRCIDDIRDDVERELNKAQAGGWLNRIEEEDDRILAISNGIYRCIAECDELDGLLTLYSAELGTLTEDVAYIEAQSQGLQVQAANQKLLQAELQSLLNTISISPKQLQSLKEASLAEVQGLVQIENSLVILFQAMITIDPTLGRSAPRASEDGSVQPGRGGIGDSEIGSMRVLQEKKEIYKSESTQFLYRLKAFLQVQFAMAIDETKKALELEGGNLSRRAGKAKLDHKNHDLARVQLWRYSPLMLFSREVNPMEWEDLMRAYETVYKPVYTTEFRDGVTAWQRTARKPTGEDNESLFTSQMEKQTEGIATTARKLTVKRSQTLAKKTFNRGEAGGRTNADRIQDGRLHPYEVFGGALEEMITLICTEQNFIVEFFHVSSLEIQDFSDCVTSASPDQRRGSDLRRLRPMDPNRDMAKKVIRCMEELFAFFQQDLQSFVNWALQHDPIQGVGVMAAIERKLLELEETNQEFLSRVLQKVHTSLKGLFNNFLNEQIRAIEDTKVKIKKRKGVIGFIRIFPAFCNTLETMLVSAGDLDIRTTVNDAYGRINKSMFESLKVIAREVPSAASSGATMGDPEDKEALNYQILLIENMNHYLEEVDARNDLVLEEWKERAAAELHEHLSLYVGAVIRRPLGRLLDKLESTESVLQSMSPGTSPSEISTRPSHDKKAFQDRLASFDSKTIVKGIHELKERVEKHFAKDHDPMGGRALVSKVLDACERYYENVEERVRAISADVYQGDAAIEWTRSDVTSSFRR